MSLLFLTHDDKRGAEKLAEDFAAVLRANGEIVTIARVTDEAVCPGKWTLPESPSKPTVALSFGGDGTMLRALAMLSPYDIPTLGVNLGHLGYLTEVEPAEVEDVLPILKSGAFNVTHRMMLSASIGDTHWHAVNEIVVEREHGATVRLEVTIGGEPFTSYAVDGLILSTPTGSTAYNLSARGPILAPTMEAIVITPVSPHMLFDRALVCDPARDGEITLEVAGPRGASLVVDGVDVATLGPGEKLTVAKNSTTAKVVNLGTRSYRRILVTKLGLKRR